MASRNLAATLDVVVLLVVETQQRDVVVSRWMPTSERSKCIGQWHWLEVVLIALVVRTCLRKWVSAVAFFTVQIDAEFDVWFANGRF